MSHPTNPHPYNPDAKGITEIVIQSSPEANDSRPAPCSETDQMMEADRHHWEDEETVSITAYMRMSCMARRMEEERNEARWLLKQNAEDKERQ